MRTVCEPEALATDMDARALAASLADADAFAPVFERHFATIHRYLARRLGRDLADELTAEAFALAFEKRGSFDPALGSARPWLFGIATRLVWRHRRREERELRAFARSGVDPATDAADDRIAERADAREAGPALAAALAALSAQDRDVLLLHAWQGLSHAEIALALGIAQGTVKSRLHRARRRARETLADAGVLDTFEEAPDGRA
jgi:RNA polymerase sigma factor (sigma-70 family)